MTTQQRQTLETIATAIKEKTDLIRAIEGHYEQAKEKATELKSIVQEWRNKAEDTETEITATLNNMLEIDQDSEAAAELDNIAADLGSIQYLLNTTIEWIEEIEKTSLFYKHSFNIDQAATRLNQILNY